MRLNLFQSKEPEKIDIYYHEMTSSIEKIIAIVKQDKPVLYGSVDGEKVPLELDDILYFDTVDRRTFVYTIYDTYQIPNSISSLESDLSPYGFIRINKSNIVNIYQIKKIKPEPNMKVTVLLTSNEILQINRAYKKSFQDYLEAIRKSI